MRHGPSRFAGDKVDYKQYSKDYEKVTVRVIGL